jgi:hypothetical protein
MLRVRWLRVWVFLALPVVVPSAARAAISFIYAVRSKTGQVSTAVMVLDDQRIRLEGFELEGPRAGYTKIFDLRARRLIWIDNKRKAYSTLTEAGLQLMKSRIAQSRARIAEHSKNMPPAQRQQMEEQTAAMMADFEYQAMGQKKTIAGHSCDMYRLLQGKRLFGESCVALWGSNIVTKAEAEEFKRAGAALRKMFDGMPEAWSQRPGILLEQVLIGSDGCGQ